MKQFLAVYIGTPQAIERSGWSQLNDAQRKARQVEGMQAWKDWGRAHADAIVAPGGPLGKTKQVSPDGVADIKNAMAAYVILRAESHEAAAKLFDNHPHFTIFPGDSVEIVECLPLPEP